MNKSKKILEFRDKLEIDYLAVRNNEKYIDNITNVLILTHRILVLASILRSLNREINGLSYE